MNNRVNKYQKYRDEILLMSNDDFVVSKKDNTKENVLNKSYNSQNKGKNKIYQAYNNKRKIIYLLISIIILTFCIGIIAILLMVFGG